MIATPEYQRAVLGYAAAFIAAKEGFRPDPYDDADGVALKEKNGQCLGKVTVGYGFTEASIGSRVHESMTQEEAKETFVILLKKMYAPAVFSVLTHEVPVCVAAALVSCAYNAGPAAMQKSPMVTAILAKDIEGAARTCLSWRITYKGEICKGLVNRRKDESELMLGRYYVQPWETLKMNLIRPIKQVAPVRGG